MQFQNLYLHFNRWSKLLNSLYRVRRLSYRTLDKLLNSLYRVGRLNFRALDKLLNSLYRVGHLSSRALDKLLNSLHRVRRLSLRALDKLSDSLYKVRRLSFRGLDSVATKQDAFCFSKHVIKSWYDSILQCDLVCSMVPQIICFNKVEEFISLIHRNKYSASKEEQ